VTFFFLSSLSPGGNPFHSFASWSTGHRCLSFSCTFFSFFLGASPVLAVQRSSTPLPPTAFSRRTGVLAVPSFSLHLFNFRSFFCSAPLVLLTRFLFPGCVYPPSFFSLLSPPLFFVLGFWGFFLRCHEGHSFSGRATDPFLVPKAGFLPFDRCFPVSLETRLSPLPPAVFWVFPPTCEHFFPPSNSPFFFKYHPLSFLHFFLFSFTRCFFPLLVWYQPQTFPPSRERSSFPRNSDRTPRRFLISPWKRPVRFFCPPRRLSAQRIGDFMSHSFSSQFPLRQDLGSGPASRCDSLPSGPGGSFSSLIPPPLQSANFFSKPMSDGQVLLRGQPPLHCLDGLFPFFSFVPTNPPFFPAVDLVAFPPTLSRRSPVPPSGRCGLPPPLGSQSSLCHVSLPQ